jgi:hypothetical protein
MTLWSHEVLSNPVRLGESAPNILICTAARPLKLARATAANGGSRATTAHQPQSLSVIGTLAR